MPSDDFHKLRQLLGLRRRELDTPLERVREDFERFARLFPLEPGVEVEEAEVGGVAAEWVASPGVREGRALLLLHGGGFVSGSPATHRDLAARLSAAAGCRVLVPAYRLAPEHPFPAALEDVSAVYRALLDAGQAPALLAVAGDSAGANLALAMMLDSKHRSMPLPAGAALLSPWLDLTLAGESMVSRASEDLLINPAMLRKIVPLYLGGPVDQGGTDPRDRRVSPLFGNLHGLPPLLLQVGSAEVLLDDAARLGARAEGRGVEVRLEVWPEMLHVWHSFAGLLPEGRQAIEGVGAFARELFQRAGTVAQMC